MLREVFVQENYVMVIATLALLLVILITIACELMMIYHMLDLIKEGQEDAKQNAKFLAMNKEEANPSIASKKVAIFKRCVV